MRKLVCTIAFVSLSVLCNAQNGGSAPPAVLHPYTNNELGFTLNYPGEFVPDAVPDMNKVFERGHASSHGLEPSDDPRFKRVSKCLLPLLYASSEPPADNETVKLAADYSQDFIFVADIDKHCVPARVTGDAIYTYVAVQILHLPQYSAIKTKIGVPYNRLGGPVVGPPYEPTDVPTNTDMPNTEVAGFERNGHRILVISVSGSPGFAHPGTTCMTLSGTGSLFPGFKNFCNRDGYPTE